MALPIIGVLALQGAVEPHRKHIEAYGAEFRAVKTPQQFESVDAFILPGGESTTMLKLIEAFDLWDSLVKQFAMKPVWGICAGSILMADRVENPPQKSFGLLPITVQRNAYGRQLESHHALIDGYEVSFIRAPVIISPSPSIPLPSGRGKVSEAKQGEGLEIRATHEGNPVWVQKGQYMATTFHPELTLDFPSPMHREFVNLARNKGKVAA
ncbi:MAG: pyridoxal 5'-phosphate synthase glutaminase subunit PdxT [Alphaproteobacteria bacterium]